MTSRSEPCWRSPPAILRPAGNMTTQLHQRCSTLQLPELPQRLPETLLLMFASDQNVLHEECIAFLATIVETQIRAGRNSGPIRWINSSRNCSLKIAGISLTSITASQPDNGLRSDTVGDRWQMPLQLNTGPEQLADIPGRPGRCSPTDSSMLIAVQCGFSAGTMMSISSSILHSVAHMCWSVFCSSAPWANAFPFVGGSWLRPGPSFTTLQTGGLYRADPDIAVSPRLSRTDDWTHYRISVTSDRVVWFLNGRPVYEQPLSEIQNHGSPFTTPLDQRAKFATSESSDSPLFRKKFDWQSSRSLQLRIPYRSLMSQAGLPGMKTRGSQRRSRGPSSGTSLVSHGFTAQKMSRSKVPGSNAFCDYHWPLLWDCTVDFEFFYQSGSTEVHPALGSTAILLRPGAVTTHQITDGFWEPFGRDPLSESTITQSASDSTDAPITTPHLIDQQWNHCRLELRGSRCLVYLNEKLVFDHLWQRTVIERSDCSITVIRRNQE